MTDVAAIAFASGSVIIAALAHFSFGSWLKQRERERLTAIDKAELLAMFKEVDHKLLVLKNEPARR